MPVAADLPLTDHTLIRSILCSAYGSFARFKLRFFALPFCHIVYHKIFPFSIDFSMHFY